MKQSELSRKVIGCGIEVHRELGPGLLESTYQRCLAHELGLAGISFKVQKLAADMQGTAEARQILDEIESRIDQLDGDKAEALLELLMAEYR